MNTRTEPEIAAGDDVPLRAAGVIPAFNEVSTIRDIVARAARELDKVIVVDDGSSDGTAVALAGLPVTLLSNPVNLGKSESLRKGMLHAVETGASAIITLDADGQHRPEDIPRLIAAHRRAPGAIIIGARLRDRGKMPGVRYAANCFANFWISWAAGYRVSDSQSGFRLYPARVIAALDLSKDRSRAFVFESAVLINAAWMGVRSVSVRISAIYSQHTRASYFRPVVDVLLITRMVAWKLLKSGFNIRRVLETRQCAKTMPQSDTAS